MKYVQPYPTISRYRTGSYGWAMDQVFAGNDMRRWGWPIEVRPSTLRKGDTYTAIWKIYQNGSGSPCKGFSSGVVGADNDAWGDLGTDSSGYCPKPEDVTATDWQFASEVTPDQIAYLDTHRMTVTPNPYIAEYMARERASDRRLALYLFLIAAGIVAVPILIWFHL